MAPIDPTELGRVGAAGRAYVNVVASGSETVTVMTAVVFSATDTRSTGERGCFIDIGDGDGDGLVGGERAIGDLDGDVVDVVGTVGRALVVERRGMQVRAPVALLMLNLAARSTPPAMAYVNVVAASGSGKR